MVAMAALAAAAAGCASASGGLSTGANADLVVLSVGIDYAATPNGVSALANPARDARLVGDAFSRIRGAEITTLAEPVAAPGGALDYALFEQSTSRFLESARGRTAVFYFAGHGVQVDGDNYLVLGDGRTLVPVLPFLDRLAATAEAVVVFLDACRNNPFDDSAPAASVLEVRTTRSGVSAERFGHPDRIALDAVAGGRNGLARLSRGVGEGSVVVFATEAGDVAVDSAAEGDRNSPFAMAVARQIGERRSVGGVVAAIQAEVLRRTNGDQNPVAENALGGRRVFLAGRPITPM